MRGDAPVKEFVVTCTLNGGVNLGRRTLMICGHDEIDIMYRNEKQ